MIRAESSTTVVALKLLIVDRFDDVMIPGVKEARVTAANRNNTTFSKADIGSCFFITIKGYQLDRDVVGYVTVGDIVDNKLRVKLEPENENKIQCNKVPKDAGDNGKRANTNKELSGDVNENGKRSREA